MALEICVMCFNTKIIPGPRNEKIKGLCEKKSCKKKALISLKEQGLLSSEEEAELQKLQEEDNGKAK